MQQICSVEVPLMRVGWGWAGDDRVCVDSIDSFRVCYQFAAVVTVVSFSHNTNHCTGLSNQS